MRTLSLLTVALCVLGLYVGSALQAQPAGTFTNPILPGGYPYSSICRVGQDYYMVNSSFEYFRKLPMPTPSKAVEGYQGSIVLRIQARPQHYL